MQTLVCTEVLHNPLIYIDLHEHLCIPNVYNRYTCNEQPVLSSICVSINIYIYIVQARLARREYRVAKSRCLPYHVHVCTCTLQKVDSNCACAHYKMYTLYMCMCAYAHCNTHARLSFLPMHLGTAAAAERRRTRAHTPESATDFRLAGDFFACAFALCLFALCLFALPFALPFTLPFALAFKFPNWRGALFLGSGVL